MPYRPPDHARPSQGELWGLAVVVGVVVATAVVMFTEGPLWGTVAGIALAVLAIVAVTLADR